jgi:hypothetical protein
VKAPRGSALRIPPIAVWIVNGATSLIPVDHSVARDQRASGASWDHVAGRFNAEPREDGSLSEATPGFDVPEHSSSRSYATAAKSDASIVMSPPKGEVSTW